MAVDAYFVELQLAFIARGFESAEKGLLAAREDDNAFIENVLGEHQESERMKRAKHWAKEADLEIARSMQSVRKAFVLANFSAFEFGVVRVAENYLNSVGSRLGLSDLAGSGYEKFHLVAKKIACVQLHNDELWEAAPHYRKIRNKIAHNGGYCLNLDEKNGIKNAIKFLGNASLGSDAESGISEIELESRFVVKMNALMVMLVRSAHETLNEVIPC